ncbi:MAG: YkgJ family cysteine cluster protein [Deltaproteobacteria bacterium]|nr:YkgJ family cysteine cluster protein [Deltaproteobacteria bacterium]
MSGISCDRSAFEPIPDNRFRFHCHKGIQCFTMCCADLNLLLTPYDIVRLRSRLKISSAVFLDLYSETRIDDRNRFPMVYLKMNNDQEKRCPFVTPDGCDIYEDRPGACRIYPLGRAASRPEGKKETTERFFMVKEDHCQGFQEDKEWTIAEWIGNEGLDEYNDMNDEWMEVITSSKGLGEEKDLPRKIQMFSMASYNPEKFREFIFKSRFFSLFEVSPELREKLSSDDKALLKFSIKWLRFSLFGEQTMKIRGQAS